MRERLRFNGRSILVSVSITGPAGVMRFRFALDTGATYTTISPGALRVAGYGLDGDGGWTEVVTAGGLLSVQRARVERLGAMGHRRDAFPVLAHALPAAARIDGLLGLDFLRGRRLTIDFAAETIELI